MTKEELRRQRDAEIADASKDSFNSEMVYPSADESDCKNGHVVLTVDVSARYAAQHILKEIPQLNSVKIKVKGTVIHVTRNDL
jgi:hypothetical protein